MPILLNLFLTFLKIGAVSFGGGYGMIPLVTEEAISNFGLTSEQVMNFIAVAESTPGPIAINMATFIGASQAGFLGALLATIGVVLPSFVIILLIVALLTGLMQYKGVKGFLLGVRPVVCGLIIATAIGMLLNVVIGVEVVGDVAVFDYKSIIIFGVVATTHFVYKKKTDKAISPIILIVIAAVLGMILYGLVP